MSILDFAENPDYTIVAVAVAKHDVAVLFGAKPEKLEPVLTLVIEVLRGELAKLKSAAGNS